MRRHLHIRNVFDQYQHTENRLSHALAVTLHEDREFRQASLSEVGGPAALDADHIVEVQTLPSSDDQTSEVPSERRSLPDIVLHDRAKSVCIAIEAKVQSPLSDDQLRRHRESVRNRGFGTVCVVALTACDERSHEADAHLRWSQLDDIAKRFGPWCSHLRDYLRTMQDRLRDDGHLERGSLAMFDGFGFSPNNPFTIETGRRALREATPELLTHEAMRTLAVNTGWEKPAITDRHTHVFTTFRFAEHPPSKDFSQYPHITLSAHHQHAQAEISISNACPNSYRERLAALGSDGLRHLHMHAVENAKRAGLLAIGAEPQAYALQRHGTGTSPRLASTVDAEARFHLEASGPAGIAPSHGLMRSLPHWTDLYHQLLCHRIREGGVNIHFGYCIRLPWSTPGMNSPEAIDLIARSWLALKPILDVVRDPR